MCCLKKISNASDSIENEWKKGPTFTREIWLKKTLNPKPSQWTRNLHNRKDLDTAPILIKIYNGGPLVFEYPYSGLIGPLRSRKTRIFLIPMEWMDYPIWWNERDTLNWVVVPVSSPYNAGISESPYIHFRSNRKHFDIFLRQKKNKHTLDNT